MTKKIMIVLCCLIATIGLFISCDNNVPHVHKFEKGEILQDASCTRFGMMEFTCDCGVKTLKKLPMLDHDWDVGKITIEATVDAPGIKKYTCINCGKTEERETEKHVHSYEWVSVKKSYVSKGLEHYKCKCGDVIDERETEPLSLVGEHWEGIDEENFLNSTESKYYKYYNLDFKTSNNIAVGFGFGQDGILYTKMDNGITYKTSYDETRGIDKIDIVIEGVPGNENCMQIEFVNIYNDGTIGLKIAIPGSDITKQPETIFKKTSHNHTFVEHIPENLKPLNKDNHGYPSECKHDYIIMEADQDNRNHNFKDKEGNPLGHCVDCGYKKIMMLNYSNLTNENVNGSKFQLVREEREITEDAKELPIVPVIDAKTGSATGKNYYFLFFNGDEKILFKPGAKFNPLKYILMTESFSFELYADKTNITYSYTEEP